MVIKHYNWSFFSLFGYFDNAQLQRGLQVFQQNCANCHSLNYITPQSLAGIGLSKQQINKLAKEYNITIDKSIPAPFSTEADARDANNGAFPPDLTNITLQRSSGANYVASLLTGYESTEPSEQGYKNTYYYNGKYIAMPPPLTDTPAKQKNEAKDVAAFLYWCGHPNMIKEKQVGFTVVFFLIFLLTLLAMLLRTKGK